MVLQYLLQAIVYISVIALIHYLYVFFKENLTTPKTIHIVNRIKQDKTTLSKSNNNTTSEDSAISTSMKEELKEYFKTLNQTTEKTTEDEIVTYHIEPPNDGTKISELPSSSIDFTPF